MFTYWGLSFFTGLMLENIPTQRNIHTMKNVVFGNGGDVHATGKN